MPCRSRWLLGFFGLLLIFLGPTEWTSAGDEPAGDFTSYPGYAGPTYDGYTTEARYVTARDGTRLAIDLHLPEGLEPGAAIPTVMRIVRYWRSEQLRWPASLFHGNSFVRYLTRHGYAVVMMDVRGTGASFGRWRLPYAPEQLTDAGRDVVQWIVEQPWSNGAVGAQGISYSANTAAFLPVPNHPAVKAVVPRFIDFDQYSSLPFPGGVPNRGFLRLWSDLTRELDRNEMELGFEVFGASWLERWALRGVKPVDADRDRSLLRAAVAEHRNNVDLMSVFDAVTFRDDVPEGFDLSIDQISLHRQREAVERSGAAYFLWGSWLDAGTANGVLSHFFGYSNPRRAVIGGWTHGADSDADPWHAVDAPLWPDREAQLRACLRFLDHHLKGIDTGMMAENVLHYYTMGEGKWKTSAVWPPQGTQLQRLYLGVDRTLSESMPRASAGADEYAVDFEATSGKTNRWYTQLDNDVVYDRRAEQISRTLSYRSDRLPEDTEITGHVVVTLHVRSTHSDGAFYVYLDAEGPNGEIVYLTDGQLRALHRKISDADPPYRIWEPYHSFERADGAPLVPGELAELSFGLQPTSVRVPAGWRLLLSIAGHDADTFTRIPAEGGPVISIERNSFNASYVDLPVVRSEDSRKK